MRNYPRTTAGDGGVPEAEEPRGGGRRGSARDTRKDERAVRARPSRPGGVTAACGCRFVRVGGNWVHVTPGHGHRLRPGPVSDEEMRAIGAEARR